MKLLFILALFFVSTLSLAKEADPNNYFKDRTWTVDAGKLGQLIITNTYVAEPVQLPNKLTVELQCPGSKKKITAIKELKYCGVDAVSVQGDKIELMLVDYDPQDSRGYCMKKRKEYHPLPKCK
ncbi:MAG: hypothetical protein KDD33_06040 [Bdellovibrionales bacterium]|nr:hypothetical protein [Bdellovibrionales bacterium]